MEKHYETERRRLFRFFFPTAGPLLTANIAVLKL